VRCEVVLTRIRSEIPPYLRDPDASMLALVMLASEHSHCMRSLRRPFHRDDLAERSARTGALR
jgi:hypothetical protein